MIVGYGWDPCCCCTSCKTGGCIRNQCPGDGCPCAGVGEPHGHVSPEEVAAAVFASMVAGLPPVDEPPPSPAGREQNGRRDTMQFARFG